MTVLSDLGPRGTLRGASWGRDGRIVFAASDMTTGLLVISEAGGTIATLTTPADTDGERDHRWPQILPNDSGILFAILRADGTQDIAVLPGGSQTWRVLIRDAGAPRYLSPGFIVYAVRGVLYGVRFDVRSLYSGQLYPTAWSPDGRRIAFIQQRPRLTTLAVDAAPPHEVRPMAQGSGAQVELAYSPDGRWVAHAAFTGELPEIVLGPADNPQRRWPVADRGRYPTWSAKGRELLFLEAAAIHAIPIDPATGQATGRARKIVDLPPRTSVNAVEPTTDGTRFLVRERVDDSVSRMDIRIVLNWLEEVRGKIP